MSTLVICGDEFDKAVFKDLGFSNVTISNLDQRNTPDYYSPYKWMLEDAENLSFPDNEFDLVVVHAGLHHCRSPHKALLEMYRVARKTVLVFETRDNFLVRLGNKVGLVSDYEVEAVVGNNNQSGGVRNTEIPNFIYRFREREVFKTIQSFAPEFKHEIKYFYGLNMPLERLRVHKNKALVCCAFLSYPFVKLLTWLFPKQSNLFSFSISKPDKAKDHWPWISLNAGSPTLNVGWCENRFLTENMEKQ